MPADGFRTPSSQSPGRRLKETRETMWVDPEGASIIHDLHQPGPSGTDIPAAEPANTGAGKVFRVLGVDNITVLVDVRQGGAVSNLHIVPQVSWVKPGESGFAPNAPEWYDLYAEEANDGILVRKDFERAIAGDLRYAFRIPTRGKYMRFKVWGDGAAAGDRCTIRVIRGQDSWGASS